MSEATEAPAASSSACAELEEELAWDGTEDDEEEDEEGGCVLMSNEDEEARGVDEVVGALQELVLMDPGFAAMQDNLFRKYAGRGGTRQREGRVVVDGRRDRSTTAFCLYVCMQRCSTMMTGRGVVRTSCATWRHSETTHRRQARPAASPLID